MSLKTKAEGSTAIENKEHVESADLKQNTNWLIVDETSLTTASDNNSLPSQQLSTSSNDLPNKSCPDDK